MDFWTNIVMKKGLSVNGYSPSKSQGRENDADTPSNLLLKIGVFNKLSIRQFQFILSKVVPGHCLVVYNYKIAG